MFELKDSPLTEQQFKEMQEMVPQIYCADYLVNMTYEMYLAVREELAKRFTTANISACCMTNPSHQVNIVWSGKGVSITEDAATGKILQQDLSGDCEAICVNGCVVDYGDNLDEYEKVVRK